MLLQRAALEVTETTLRGRVLSAVSMIAMTTLFILETKAYFSPTLETDLLFDSNNDEDQLVQLNFDITTTNLQCDYATVDVYSSIGGARKNVTANIRKYPVDDQGVRQQYEARNWHQNDVELWDPAVPETLEDLHEDGEDAISLNDVSFPYALKQFPFLFVKFYTNDCTNCEDVGPTWEALGEVVTDTSMSIVDEYMTESDLGSSDAFSDDEYETAVNEMAPVLVTKLNCSDYPDVCTAQGISVYPTMRVFVDGQGKGDYNGHRTVMELVHWLSYIEANNREPGELKMHYVLEYASERTVRNEEEEEWNDALAEYRAPHNSWNVTRHPGCQLVGHVMVDKAPGKFVIHAESYGHDFAAHMTNLSHIVEHFSFGDKHELQDVPEELPPKFLRSLHPMDGNVYVTGELHQAYHHHMKVITTDFFCGSKVMQWTKGKCTRLFRILQNSQLSTYRRNIVPEVKWSYEISPMAVSYLEESRSWYDYLTGVLAIVGGTFTVVGMLESGLSSYSKQKRSFYE